MKKLTAGIFTVLMGLVSVNAADAAVASKAYVDEVAAAEASAAQLAAETTAAGALSSAKTELEGKINAKVSQADYDAKIEALEAADETFATTSAMNTELAKKQNNLNVTGGILSWDANTSTLGLTGIATDSSVTALEGKVNTLDGDVNTAGSVKKQIADAIAGEVSRSDSYADKAEADAIATAAADATSKADAALAAAKTYAEGEADAAEAAAKSYADGLADDYDAAGSAADALADAKEYTDALANGAVKSNTEAIAALDTNYVSETEMNTFKASNTDAIADAKKAGTDAQADLNAYKTTNNEAVAAAAQAAANAASAAADALADAKAYADEKDTALKSDLEGQIAQKQDKLVGEQLAAVDSGITSTKVEAYDAYAGQISSVTTTADSALEKANAAIPAPKPECSDKGSKCVLVSGEAGYEWEVIQRGDNE